MDPICTKSGCYMFRSGTPERTACERNCRISNRVKLPSTWANHVPPTKSSSDPVMNSTAKVLSVLASEPESAMSAETAHSLVNGQSKTPLALTTIKRSLRYLRNAGFADAINQYDRKRNRSINLWSATSKGIRRTLADS